mgnify:FL=1
MELPIFPLNGAVLFPETSLPLNIFEKRYIDMVNYSLAREREIGMIQTMNNGDLCKIGCIGKIHSFNETNDGRYLISLQGLNCFEVVKEIYVDYSFRIVRANVIKGVNKEDNKLDNDKKSNILKKYKKYISSKKINIDLSEIDGIEIYQLMKFIAMISPFKDIEKQALLETDNVEDFYYKLLSIIDFDIASELGNKTLN